MQPHQAMEQIDTQLSHVWMVRAFLKHSDEADEDDEVRDLHRALYDYMLALGKSWKSQDADLYLKQARKKWPRLARAAARFREIQPDVSTHTNYMMAARSLTAAVGAIERVLGAAGMLKTD